jgi:hypothetical protein
MKKITFVFTIICLLVITDSHAQYRINLSNRVEEIPNTTNGGSSVSGHIAKYGFYYDVSEFYCGLPEYAVPTKLFTVNQQADLIYSTTYHDSTMLQIATQGYFRLVYVNSEIGYCWRRDLVWTYFDTFGKIQKTIFYNKGTAITSPEFSN